ncbi:MAG: hypothetical protein E7661_04630 [Ruminococcaceae bacterium]|nr:hypothetical protein [Oscillospiraceae bacterium]
MKSKMLVPYRHAWLFVIIAIFLLLVLGFLAYALIKDNNGGLAFLCLPIASIVPISLMFLFNYGIRINSKRIIAIEQNQIKILPYDEVRRITVRFMDDRVTALIKMMDNREYLFVWDALYMGYNFWHTSPLWVKTNIKKDFVSQSVASLSACEKVLIQDCRKNKGHL